MLGKISQPESGYTVIEIIAVFVVLGIVSAYVAKASMEMIDESDYISQIHQLRTHLKYAQIKSVNSDYHWGIDFSGSQYALFRWEDSDPGTQIYHFFPGNEQSTSEDPLTKGTVGITLPDSDKYWTTDFCVWFDDLGRAYAVETFSAAVSSQNEISNEFNVVCTGSESGDPIIQIEPKTGYILCDYQ